ncbi:MAG: hypothetical protein HUN04_06720 [Desulfobacter sp.]|nr:MAG: hypothetical protein HUN04_06720 [Desulfobacter sp.]
MKNTVLVPVIAGLFLGSLWAFPGPGLGARQEVHWNRKVYIALGFHGNLYHSFRGDTNDENGFGRDIRIIRHIIETLDRFNDRGVPVRGSWEFDNHFSLENILPLYAPDIIRDIRRRIESGRDEILLMSYNNGLASAMTRRELTRAVQWAISNPWGSGVQDLFGRYTPVVRPQEMMTTPGDFNVYRQAGIEAVALYYSATPFDTFRLFSRPLSRDEAHNPLEYKNDATSEEILVVPTYNIGDLVENVSLGEWVEALHKMQRKGEIKRDVLVFINFDADSEYWTGADRLTWPLNRLPNTRGLEGLIREVDNKTFVRFTTLKAYLAEHGPAGRVTFQQDTADGSFDGYNSWSEKWESTAFWTRIMAARRMHRTASKVVNLFKSRALADQIRPLLDEAFRLRLQALSTTHFGMGTPFVAPQREAAMEKILSRLDKVGSQIRQVLDLAVQRKLARRTRPKLPRGLKVADTLMVINPGTGGRCHSRFLSVPGLGGGTGYRLLGEQGQTYPLVPVPGLEAEGVRRFYVSGPRPVPDGFYFLCPVPLPGPVKDGPVAVSFTDGAVLKNKAVEAVFDSRGRLKYLRRQGESLVGPGGMGAYLKYREEEFRPGPMEICAVGGNGAGWAALGMAGKWPGPGNHTIAGGHTAYSMGLVGDLPYLFVDGEVRYPATIKADRIKSDLPGIARDADLGWQETAPMEIRLDGAVGQDSPVRIYKNNFMDEDTAYDLDYHRYSPENLALDNVNNHITAGYAGIFAKDKGLAISFDPGVAANFAGAPARVRVDSDGGRSVSINPLGTYHGSQNRRPTWGNGQGHEASLISGEQYHSAAPTFNGKTTRFSMMLGGFSGDRMPEKLKRDLKAFASPGVVFSLRHRKDATDAAVAPGVPAEYEAAIDRGRLTLRWAGDERLDYVVRMGTTSKRYPHVFRCSTNSLTLDGLSPLKPFRPGERYFAVIESVSPDGGIPSRTREIRLEILDSNRITAETKIPWQFPLKVLWANLKAIFM